MKQINFSHKKFRMLYWKSKGNVEYYFSYPIPSKLVEVFVSQRQRNANIAYQTFSHRFFFLNLL